MTILDIRLFGDPVLNTRAQEVNVFDDNLATLIDDMLETMDDAGGVGLAANQVGVLKRVFVYDCSHIEAGLRGHIINPVWEPIGEETQTGTEGCLSIPDISFDTKRWEKVKVTGVDVNGSPVSMVASGLMARCIQHETDHLDGVLFLRKLSPELRKEAMAQIRQSQWFNN
ncbi:peptide deformylase [Corynebacterium sp. sy017]|uniref:peptide deformylase n=1 Tax=unclassified Corynebacterium TaxID=2624378 RepID=UPI001186210B|nr:MULTISPECIES: peptide deformylase [unclassified Corynebacterium]MBP3087678.1 peptide deformylase [Corynebacterium sp. sy017]QDZ42664.1 peptide deformylase [Corynebacterium sp. sy039]TSD92238.1 peptide deformylase [Corynebacterium sp. SY003]